MKKFLFLSLAVLIGLSACETIVADLPTQYDYVAAYANFDLENHDIGVLIDQNYKEPGQNDYWNEYRRNEVFTKIYDYNLNEPYHEFGLFVNPKAYIFPAPQDLLKERGKIANHENIIPTGFGVKFLKAKDGVAYFKDSVTVDTVKVYEFTKKTSGLIEEYVETQLLIASSSIPNPTVEFWDGAAAVGETKKNPTGLGLSVVYPNEYEDIPETGCITYKGDFNIGAPNSNFFSAWNCFSNVITLYVPLNADGTINMDAWPNMLRLGGATVGGNFLWYLDMLIHDATDTEIGVLDKLQMPDYTQGITGDQAWDQLWKFIDEKVIGLDEKIYTVKVTGDAFDDTYEDYEYPSNL